MQRYTKRFERVTKFSSLRKYLTLLIRLEYNKSTSTLEKAYFFCSFRESENEAKLQKSKFAARYPEPLYNVARAACIYVLKKKIMMRNFITSERIIITQLCAFRIDSIPSTPVTPSAPDSSSNSSSSSSSPLSASSVYFTTSESKARFLTRYSQDVVAEQVTTPSIKSTTPDNLDLRQKKVMYRL